MLGGRSDVFLFCFGVVYVLSERVVGHSKCGGVIDGWGPLELEWRRGKRRSVVEGKRVEMK